MSAAGAAAAISSHVPPLRSSTARSLHIVGLALQRWFSAPLSFDAREPWTFNIASKTLPPHLAQFQETLDIALGTLPPVDWERCKAGDAMVSMLVRQIRRASSPRSNDTAREPEPHNELDVFMNLPHNDEYWPGADHFVVSDGPWRTLFYDSGIGVGVPTRFPERAVVRYDGSYLHSGPGFCAAGLDDRQAPASGKGVAPRREVLRTFLRIIVWDPRWSLLHWPQYAGLLGPPTKAEWERPQICEAEDVIHGCFDEEHTCERCCDLSKGPIGDSVCWAGWITYQKCCGPASRRWAGCGWHRGVDLWAHEYYSFTPPRLHSPAQCQQRCEEDPDCGGWTYFPQGWQPFGCRFPFAAILSARGSCVLRSGAEEFTTPHKGLIWGPRDCDEGDSGCLEFDVDRIFWEVEYSRDVQDVTACRGLCKSRRGCRAFAFFPWDYVGDPSPGCIMPAAMHAFWETRCLLKSVTTRGTGEWFLPMGGVVSGSRRCEPASPWLSQLDGKGVRGDAHLAIDGDYARAACSRVSPWRMEFDAEYTVGGVVLWTGDIGTLQTRPRRRYVVSVLLAHSADAEEALCGTALETTGGRPLTVQCDEHRPPARGLVVRAEISDAGHGIAAAAEMALCEVEARLEPVPCSELIEHAVVIGAWQVRVFPAGAAALLDATSPAGQACERHGGGLVGVAARRGGAVCVEAACAPTPCLEAFDASPGMYASLSGFAIWDERIEAAADACRGLEREAGRYFEATVRVHEGDGVMATMHFGFCAPGICRDDGASSVALRMAAAKGVELPNLMPGASVSIQNVRPFARWEDVQLDFLVAGFARSGTHSVQGNLALHPECLVAKEELTFNWGYLPMLSQMREYERHFHDGDGRRITGGKGEGVVFSPRLLRLLSRAPRLKLIVVVREPVEWLESLYNLRALGCRQGRNCDDVPALEDIILKDATLQDVRAEFAELGRALEHAVEYFPPSSGRLLLLEFELLRSRPREFFDRICDFLGISRFVANFSFEAYATGDRKAYSADGTKSDLCAPKARPALDALRFRLAARNEHQRIAQLLAVSGAPWISSRMLLGTDHCS